MGAGRFALKLTCILGTVLALSACAEGKYPSLAQRPVERSASKPALAPPPVPLAEPVPPALGAQLATLLSSAREAHKTFLARRDEAARLVAAAQGAAVPSDAWAAANEALAELDSNRTDLASAQDQLERLYIDDRVTHAIEDGNAVNPDSSGSERPVARAIAAARDEVLTMAGTEDSVLSDLKGQMPG